MFMLFLMQLSHKMEHDLVFAIVIEKQNMCQLFCCRYRRFHHIENIEISAKITLLKSCYKRRRLLIYQETPDISGIFCYYLQANPSTFRILPRILRQSL